MSLETHPNIVADALAYFAKFPLHTSVMGMFKKPESPFTQYAPLQTALNELSEKELVPELKGFVFGPDEDVIKRQIEDLGGEMFLFLDYGGFSTSKHPVTNTLTDSFDLSITVARPFKPEDLDIPEMINLSDETLNAMRKIREQMIADQQCSPFMRQILFPTQVHPWYARNLQNSQGWTLVMQRSTIEML